MGNKDSAWARRAVRRLIAKLMALIASGRPM
jgi:hypothetical protein